MPVLNDPRAEPEHGSRPLRQAVWLSLAFALLACGGQTHGHDDDASAEAGGADAAAAEDASPRADAAPGEDAAVAVDSGGLDTAPPSDASSVDAPDAADAEPMADGSAASDAGADPCLGSPSQAVCVQAVMHHCDAQGHSTSEESCSSAAQCQLGTAAQHCPVCSPNANRCVGAVLSRCNSDGSAWVTLETCSSAALCNEASGACTAAACTSSTRACMGDDLYGCANDLTSLTLLQTCDAGLCDSAEQACDACAANARSCVDGAVEACDSQGHAITRTACTGNTPKCIAGNCVQCLQPSDCPVQGACTQALCNANATCVFTNSAAHAACPEGVCNGSGACVGCVDSTDCKSAGKTMCLAGQCVQCVDSDDCAAGYQCDPASHSCERVSIAGTGGSCRSVSTPSNGKCGSYFCGVTPSIFDSAFDPSAVCGTNSSFMCGGSLLKIASDCFSESSILPGADLTAATATCIKKKSSVQNAGIQDGCIGCFAQQQACCRTDVACNLACLDPVSLECDNAMKAKGCVAELFGCSGLPNPL
jgi:hypothetical protein